MKTPIQTIRRQPMLFGLALVVAALAAPTGNAGAGRSPASARSVRAPVNPLALARRFSEPGVRGRNLPAPVNPLALARRFSESTPARTRTAAAQPNSQLTALAPTIIRAGGGFRWGDAAIGAAATLALALAAAGALALTKRPPPSQDFGPSDATDSRGGAWV
jgi:hypothetical protein